MRDGTYQPIAQADSQPSPMLTPHLRLARLPQIDDSRRRPAKRPAEPDLSTNALRAVRKIADAAIYFLEPSCFLT